MLLLSMLVVRAACPTWYIDTSEQLALLKAGVDYGNRELWFAHAAASEDANGHWVVDSSQALTASANITYSNNRWIYAAASGVVALQLGNKECPSALPPLVVANDSMAGCAHTLTTTTGTQLYRVSNTPEWRTNPPSATRVYMSRGRWCFDNVNGTNCPVSAYHTCPETSMPGLLSVGAYVSQFAGHGSPTPSTNLGCGTVASTGVLIAVIVLVSLQILLWLDAGGWIRFFYTQDRNALKRQ